MNLLQIRYFVAVAEELNFRKASERLHVSQPPLSFHIKSLEEELGLPLFNRSTRHVALTEAGSALLERARQILDLFDRTQVDMHDMAAGAAGTLRVAFTISTSFHSFFHRIVHSYRETWPKVNLLLSSLPSGPQIAALTKGDLDIGLLRWPFEVAPGLITTRLHSASLVLAMHRTHELADADKVNLAHLRGNPFITYPQSMDREVGIYTQIFSLCEKAGFAPRVAHEAYEPSLMIGLVAAGAGVAIVPSSLQCMQIPGVVYKPIDDPMAATELHLVRREGGNSPRIDNFWNAALEIVALEEWSGLGQATRLQASQ
ncbi:LysR substrate-binding domain-containing protein [Sphingobium phenoxybenzoativorans]|uniref:LysR substrate-binding domain-containing protein n=1 Tax=Sphingobium phenoxybenzoativorans TaxID=1592790 RepID=UPI000871E3B2|nr:LysR substrate-binding domain-containing protein [Sphingobium phenoxybenzoativorans]